MGRRDRADQADPQAYLNRLLNEHQSGASDHSAPLWTVLMFDAFLRNVRDGQISESSAPVPALEAA